MTAANEINAWKLTDADGRTYGGCQWGPGVTHRIEDPDPSSPLCSVYWLHFYRHPLIGLFLNPVHAAYDPQTMRLWECRYDGERKDDGALKSGATILTAVREIDCPRLHSNHRVAFAIYCAESVLDRSACPEWWEWAQRWMSGKNRAIDAADAAARAAYAVYTAAGAAADAARVAARAAAYAAYADYADYAGAVNAAYADYAGAVNAAYAADAARAVAAARADADAAYVLAALGRAATLAIYGAEAL